MPKAGTPKKRLKAKPPAPAGLNLSLPLSPHFTLKEMLRSATASGRTSAKSCSSGTTAAANTSGCRWPKL